VKKFSALAVALFLFAALTACSGNLAYEYKDSGAFVTVSVVDDEGNVLLPVQKVGFEKDATVFDCTKYALQSQKMQYEVTGTGKALYIRGIDNLYELDRGPLSGWLYRVNGSFDDTGTSCGDYKVSDGDEIEWVYTTDLGEDAGAKQG
jgi:hypothetical protein